MSRAGYTNDCDSQEAQWAAIRWAGARKKAIEGKRGQAFLKELIEALDAMPEKKLIKDDLATPQGEVCALGAVLQARGVPDLHRIDSEDYERMARLTGIAETMLREIEYQNDECVYSKAGGWNQGTDEERWQWMRDWAEAHIMKVAS